MAKLYPVEQVQPRARATGAEQSPVKDVGTAAMAGALQGATLGWGDELAARVNSLFSGRDYKEVLADYRDQLSQLQAKFPVASGLGHVAGTLLTAPLIPPQLRAGMGLAQQIGRGALQGAIAGGIAGAGYAEHAPVGSAVLGGIAGAGFGGAIPPAARVVGAVGRAVVDAIPGLRGSLSRVFPFVEKPGDRALAVAGKEFELDRIPLTQAQSKLREADAAGKPFVLADLGGRNVRELADVAAANPAASKIGVDQLQTRWLEQAKRVHDDIIALSGRNPDRFRTAAVLAAQQHLRVSPQYEALMQKTMSTPVDDAVIAGILRTPSGRAAYARAQQIAADEGVQLPKVKDLQGNVRLVPNLQVLDYVKRGFDDFIEAGRRGSLGAARLHAARELRTKLRDRLDALFPEYGNLRAQWAGPERAKELIEDGADLVRRSADAREIAEVLGKLKGNEATWLRYGMMDELLARLRSTQESRDVVKMLQGNPNMRETVRLMFGDPAAYNEFVKRLGLERDMTSTYQIVTGNSRTAQRLARQQQMADEGLGDWLSQRGIAERVLRAIQGRAAAQNAGDLARLLLEDRPGSALARMIAYQEQLQRLGMKRVKLPATIAVGTGGLLSR